jgi:hypothetical protein
MALPQLASSKYELTLPSTGEKVEYRPFLVKEEKILLVAQSTGSEQDQLTAISTIIDSCTFGKLNVKELPFFDLEYIFLKLRAKSVGEISHITLTCPDDGETRVDVDINLNDLECVTNPEHTNKIELTDSIGIIMTYPKLDSMSGIGNVEQDPSKAFDVIKSSIGQIYDAENVYDRKDMDEKDLDEFIDSMSHSQLEQVQKFFATTPRVKSTVKVKNPNTGVESELTLEGMASFF